MCVRPVWSESSLSAWRNLGSLATHWAHSESSDQGGCPDWSVFAGRTLILLVLSCRGSYSHCTAARGRSLKNGSCEKETHHRDNEGSGTPHCSLNRAFAIRSPNRGYWSKLQSHKVVSNKMTVHIFVAFFVWHSPFVLVFNSSHMTWLILVLWRYLHLYLFESHNNL